MNILVVEDDVVSRNILKKLLSNYGECDIAVNGIEAFENFLSAHKDNKPYDLICLDIMMPKLDGVSVLKAIRGYEEDKSIEKNRAAKIIMTTALGDKKTIMESYDIGCDAYAWKPIDLKKLVEVLYKLKLIEK